MKWWQSPGENHLERRQMLRYGVTTAAGAGAAALFSSTMHPHSSDPGSTAAAPSATFLNVVEHGVAGDGTTDDTASLNSLLARVEPGQHLWLDPTKTFKLSGTLHVQRTLRISGAGKLTWVAGIDSAPAISVSANRSALDGLAMFNPNSLGSDSGDRSCGIEIGASEVSVKDCFIDSFQTGIIVSPAGEFANVVITGNRIKDVLGSGAGPDDVKSSAGEDRGDGITIWGCQATVTGNVVNCKAGRDARIGIHAEGLRDYEGTADQPPHPDALITVGSNVVFGPFRRGIAFEDIANSAVSGNVVADATWWSIVFSGEARACVMTGNSIIWTHADAQKQGQAWDPTRSPIMLYGSLQNCVVAANAVQVTGHAPAAITVMPNEAAKPGDCVVSGNSVMAEGDGTIDIGIKLQDANGILVTSNSVRGLSSRGLHASSSTDVTVSDNTFEGLDDPESVGIELSGGDHTLVSGNRIKRCKKGLVGNNGRLFRISGNFIDTADVGIDLQTASFALVSDNMLVNCAHPIYPAGSNHQENNNFPVSI